jgi:CPA1 family monovalent cation:H+ antiporter
LLLLSYGGGALAGVIVAWFGVQVRRRLDDPAGERRRPVDPVHRQQITPFFSLATYLLNGTPFVLVGLQVQSAVPGLTSVDLIQGCSRSASCPPRCSAPASCGCSRPRT